VRISSDQFLVRYQTIADIDEYSKVVIEKSNGRQQGRLTDFNELKLSLPAPVARSSLKRQKPWRL
jgi:hypothetical protein